MNRNRFVLAALLVLAAVGLWLLLRADPEPPRAAPIERPPVGAVAEVREVESIVRREVAAATSPDPASAKQVLDPSTEPDIFGVHGIVQEIGGDGVPDVLLELVDAAGVSVALTTSREGGHFAFNQPAPDGGFVETQLWFGTKSRLRSSLPRARSGGMLHGLAIVVWIPPPGTIEGRVVDLAGRPVEGAVVVSDRPSASLGFGRMPWAVVEGPNIEIPIFVYSDATGHFVLNFARRGAHRLRASYGEYNGSVECEVGDRGVVLALGVASGAMVLAGRLTNRVTGAPVAGARVNVILLQETSYSNSRTSVARVTTDERGYYETRGLPAGKYQLSTLPKGYARSSTPFRHFDDGRHTVDFVLSLARKLRVHVVLPDGSIPQRASIRVIDAAGNYLHMPGPMKMLRDAISVDAAGWAELRLLPAAPLTILATVDELSPAGRLEVDLSIDPPESVSVVLPVAGKRYARSHYFKLLGPDGKPAQIKGTVVAKSFVKNVLLSRVEGHWRGDEFVFGHSKSKSFSTPMIAVGAPPVACRVEIAVPGYQQETLTLELGATSPTSIRLQR